MFLSVRVPESVQPNPTPKRWGGPLKSLGAIGAVISFLLALNQVTGVAQNFRIHHKEFGEAMMAGEQEQERRDYPAAFDSFKHAAELDPIDRRAQELETRAAMLWLEDAHGTKDRSFTDLANQLLPVLDKGLARARGSAAADILAHIGWANFLRYRDGVREGVTIEENFRQALGKDASNVYAHVMWGFWILWQGGNLTAANEHFSAALASGRERGFVRDLRLHALLNAHRDETAAELLRIANGMRKNGETMSESQRRPIMENVFGDRVDDHDRLVQILSVLPADETEATYDWLNTEDNPWVESQAFRPFIAANLREIAGDRTQALAMYRTLQAQLRGKGVSLVPQVDKAIKRLSASRPD
jgi:tetratricopeptide (TPR) repeat protein